MAGVPAFPASTRAEPTQGEFGAIYCRYEPAVYSFFYHQVANIEDAEDLTATTFGKALASFDRYQDSRGTIAAWLFGIARNCLVDHFRGRHAVESLASDLPDQAAALDTVLLAAERAATIHLAIKQLPRDQREVLVLRFYAELRTSDVAAVLGKSEGAVKMLVHRAVMALRDRSRREGWR
jgi:RNA polymerase sigma-70 factor (ECF subfamily)